VFEVKTDQFLQITDMAGKQVADMIALNAHDYDEFLSPAHTRGANNSIMLQKDHGLFSNRRSRMFTIIEDTVGRHDILFPSCDRRRYLDDYGLEDHLNCRDNFLKALTEKGIDISYDRLPDPINWFMHVAIKARGELEIREPLSGRNDHVILKAHMDCLVGVSACPQDQNACNAFKPTDILIRVYA
jgi:uncharacterized protein YcgI (DUF1989 family)